MDGAWWADRDWHGWSPWLRIPEAERVLDSELLERQITDGNVILGPSWRVGHTLYTYIDFDAVTGGRSLYAMRSSGDLERILDRVPATRIHDAWLALTAPRAPAEPLAQLAFERLVEEELGGATTPLRELDEIERRRYLEAKRLATWAREQGIDTSKSGPAGGDVPDAVRLEPYIRQARAEQERLLQRLEREMAGIPGVPQAEPVQPPADHHLEEWFDAPPPGDWPDGHEPQGHQCRDTDCAAVDPDTPRPHRHRPQPDLLDGLRTAHWAMWQAAQRMEAVRITTDLLLWDAVHEQGPAARATARAMDRLHRAAEAMRKAEAAGVRHTEALRTVERHRQGAARRCAEAARPWWSHLARRSWPPAARRHLWVCADWELQLAQLWRVEAATLAGQVSARLQAAFGLAPHTVDPVGDLERLQAVLPLLRQEAVAADCLSAPERHRRLAREAEAAGRLWSWHWAGAWQIEEELRARAHISPGPDGPPAGRRAGQRVLDAYRHRETPPSHPGPGPAAPGARDD